MTSTSEKKILDLVQSLKNGNLSGKYKVRVILKWFGHKRRGANVLREIEQTLALSGLSTDPPLADTGINDQIRFQLAIGSDQIKATANSEPPVKEDAEYSFKNEVSDLQTSKVTETVYASTEDELEPENGEDEPVTKSDDRPITSQIHDWTISALRDKLDRGQLDLQPKFQREYVWDFRPELPSRLIESLFLEIPVPPIYFGKVAEGRLEMIDGQQRLTTLINYVANKFPLQKLQRMSSLNTKYFKDLEPKQQEKILDAPIRSIVIDSAGNTELRYEVFERLNRGSMVLNEQELRNCVYRGPFNDLLAELEKENYWRKVKGGIVPEQRFKEREMILRVLVFANRLEQYTGNLKRFLNEYMGQYAPREEQALKSHASFFKQTIQNIYAVFGDKAARLYAIGKNNVGKWESKFSIAALDIQFAALMNRNPAQVQEVAEQIREQYLLVIITDIDLQNAISKHTAGTAQTMIRWKKFRQLVDPIFDGAFVEPRFFSFDFRKELYTKSNKCALCNNQIHSFEDCTVDHITPYSKGGKTVPENSQLAHRACNARKSAQIPEIPLQLQA